MKATGLAVAILLLAAPAKAGDLFSGTHTYLPVADTWSPIPASGYRTLVMSGVYEPISGPIPAGPIECRGTNFWNRSIAEAQGVCVFGAGADQWMLRYRMTNTDQSAQTAERFRRIGEWRAVGGTGKYAGIIGSGTYMAEGAVGGEGRYRTQWEGEISLPK